MRRFCIIGRYSCRENEKSIAGYYKVVENE